MKKPFVREETEGGGIMLTVVEGRTSADSAVSRRRSAAVHDGVRCGIRPFRPWWCSMVGSSGWSTAVVTLLTLLAVWPLGVVDASCEFPESMRGEWFQKSYHEAITISENSLSKHGLCRERRHDKFLLYSPKDNTYSFVVITQKHPNVMQYKETPTPLRGNWTLEQAYAELTGDTPLYSLFRVNGEPVPCPFRDTFHFSYNRGSGNCSNPPSISDSCTDKSRVLFNFKACYDTHSESRKETLTCIGTWKEGSHHYLVGKMNHTAAHSDEDRFRCFIFEEFRGPNNQVEGYNVAISGDATCDGVQAPNEGSTLLYLTRSPRSKTPFPSWMFHESHHWLTLNRSRSFEISRENTSLVIQSASYIEQRWTCEDVYEIGENQAKITVHAIRGCDSGYICLNVYRRATNVLELQIGQSTPRAEDACLQSFFDPSDLDYVTLVAEPPGVVEAPLTGKFVLVHPSGALFAEMLRRTASDRLTCSESLNLWSACEGEASRFEIQSECAPTGEERKTHGKEMAVQATWSLADEHGSTKYTVVAFRDKTRELPEQRFCLALTEDLKKVFYLGTASCNRRRLSTPYKLDLYREAECPPPGTSASPAASSQLVVVVSTVLTVVHLGTLGGWRRLTEGFL